MYLWYLQTLLDFYKDGERGDYNVHRSLNSSNEINHALQDQLKEENEQLRRV